MEYDNHAVMSVRLGHGQQRMNSLVKRARENPV